MNKKQEMVKELLTRLKARNVILSDDPEDDGLTFDAPAGFWEMYPDGHHRVFPEEASVEERLSCMSLDTLERMLENDEIKDGAVFYDVWHRWGRAGYFKCKPELMELPDDCIPILRMRHDCYLHWLRDIGFQNSYDAYDSGCNGISSTNVQTALCAVSLPKKLAFPGKNIMDCSTEWNKKWAVFRKMMFISYSFQACLGKAVFWNTLEKYPDLFNRFIDETDAKVAHFELDTELGIEELREKCTADNTSYSALFEMPILIRTPGKTSMQVAAILRYTEDRVSIIWVDFSRERHCLTVEFPEWKYDIWVEEVKDTGTPYSVPYYLSQQDYLYTCWTNLSVALLGLAGFDAYSYSFDTQPGVQLFYTDAGLWLAKDCACNLKKVYGMLWERVQSYADVYSLNERISSEEKAKK